MQYPGSKLAVFILLMTLLIISVLSAQGRKIEAHLNTGGTLRGELFAVRDSALVIFTGEQEDLSSVDEIRRRTVVIKGSDVDSVVLPSESGFTPGLKKGALIGTIAGAFLGAIPIDIPGVARWGHKNGGGGSSEGFGVALPGGLEPLVGASAGLIVGAAVGAGVGLIVSNRKETLLPRSTNDYSVLRSRARYPEKEPAFLREVNVLAIEFIPASPEPRESTSLQTTSSPDRVGRWSKLWGMGV